MAALIGVFVFILWLTFDGLQLGPRLVGLASAIPHPSSLVVSAENSVLIVLAAAACLALVVAAIWLVGVTKRLSHHSVWSHEHFSGATLAQFLYVAAQCGIFSFLINYMTSEPPSLPASWLKERTSKWVEVRTAFAGSDFKDVSALAAKLTAKADPVSAFLAANLSEFDPANPGPLQGRRRQRHRGPRRPDAGPEQPDPQDQHLQRRSGSAGSPCRTRPSNCSRRTPRRAAMPRLNRLLLADAYPQELAFQDGIFGVTNQFAATLASVGFFCFLLGRVTGAAMLRKISAHKMLGLYSVINAVLCFLIFLKLGWLSVVCVFLCYFFMSITFPTIFALGIFGLGARAKAASAYIVMGIVGGALLPKLMGAMADHYDMSRGFIVPLICFVFIALYGYAWPKLSRAESLHGVGASGGH